MSQIEDPVWIKEAKKFLGLKEIPGPNNNETIVKFMKDLSHGSVTNDEVAWCGGFTGFILKTCGLPLPSNPLGARAYMELPNKILRPAVGAIAVFWRGSRTGWEGHVGFICGKDKLGNLMIISGNHNNKVDIAPYTTERLLGYRWPSIAPKEERYNLPIIASDGKIGGTEA